LHIDKGILKITCGLTAIVTVIGCLAAIGTSGTNFQASKKLKEPPFTGEIQDVEKDRSQSSDINGYTIGDKLDAGLNIQEGSDTDEDGLTDKEEIELYHTNPLKRSTAGDFYTDKEKIDLGIDPLTYSDRPDYTPIFKNNPCSEITFEAANADNLLATAEPEDGIYEHDGYEILKAYNISKYSGTLRINLSTALPDEDTIGIRTLIGSWNGSDLKEVKTQTEDGQLVIEDVITDPDEIYAVLLARKTGKKAPVYADDRIILGNDNAKGSLLDFLDFSDLENTAVDMTGRAQLAGVGCISCKYLFQFLGVKPKILYVPLGDSEKDFYNECLLVHQADIYGDTLAHYTLDDVQEVSYEDFYTYSQILNQPIFNECRTTDVTVTAKDKFWPCAFFMYCYLSDIDPNLNAKYHAKIGKVSTTFLTDFNPLYDTLPFGNFSTYASEGGNCEGITMLTLRHYLKKTVDPKGDFIYRKRIEDPSGSVTYKDLHYSWDLTKDKENSLFLSYDNDNKMNLHFYKDENFITAHEKKIKETDTELSKTLIDPSKTTDAENQFFNIITYYQVYGNQMGSKTSYMNNNFQTIQAIMDKIQAGEPVLVGVSGVHEKQKTKTEKRENDKTEYEIGCHAMLAYQYTVSDNGNIIEFRLYDCNHPFTAGTQVYQTMRVKKIVSETGNLTFQYWMQLPGYLPYTNKFQKDKPKIGYYFDAQDANFNPLP